MASTLRRVADQHGTVAVTSADLPGDLMGHTDFRTREITLSTDLTMEEWRATFVHECTHLHRGPVPARHAAAEELEVARETAAILMPTGSALAQLDHVWTEGEIAELANTYAVDRATVMAALYPPRAALEALIAYAC